MLSFFQTPYPDELWYSVIARYHTHSGALSWQATMKALFGNAPDTDVGSFFPNNSIHKILEQLPPGFLSAQEAALQHTLLPFLMRFQPQEKKAAILEAFLSGEDMRPRYLRATRDIKPRSLRYCPICLQEDTQTYGEPYWHREHQIGLMPLCPRHRCRLRDKPIPNTRPLGAQYLSLDGQDWAEPDYGALGYETALTGTLYAYLTMLYDLSPNREADNLARAMENAGLLSEDSIRKQAFDVDKLHTALTDKYGAELVKHYFGDHITKAHALRLRHYLIYSAEEYALLTVMLGQGPEVLFSQEQVPLLLETRMRELAASHVIRDKASIAKLLGIRADRLLPYAKRFGVAPFWPQSGAQKQEQERQTHTVTIHLSQMEREELEVFMRAQGMGAYSHALRYFMEAGLHKWRKEGKS
ncbi:TniQ family protein [Flavonifractor plautii]|uniref:TniQ family protein n=1 Tax=Flavonifractor plautii TaxID=292800 RepID=UPI001958D076|nr:TniQ family protein [Flavonifractor plautii]